MIGNIVQSNTHNIDAIFDTLRNLSIEKKNDNDARSSLLPLPSPPTFVEKEAELDNDEDDGITIFFRLKIIEVDFLDLLELLCTTVFDNNDGSANVVVVDAVNNNTTQSASATTYNVDDLDLVLLLLDNLIVTTLILALQWRELL